MCGVFFILLAIFAAVECIPKEPYEPVKFMRNNDKVWEEPIQTPVMSVKLKQVFGEKRASFIRRFRQEIDFHGDKPIDLTQYLRDREREEAGYPPTGVEGDADVIPAYVGNQPEAVKRSDGENYDVGSNRPLDERTEEITLNPLIEEEGNVEETSTTFNDNFSHQKGDVSKRDKYDLTT